MLSKEPLLGILACKILIVFLSFQTLRHSLIFYSLHFNKRETRLVVRVVFEKRKTHETFLKTDETFFSFFFFIYFSRYRVKR